MNYIEKKFLIPIYDVNVTLVVTPSIKESFPHFKEFEKYKITRDPIAMVAYAACNFAIFIESPSGLRHHVIAHEIFHLTHRILESIGASFDENNSEPAAYLHDYLSKIIFAELGEFLFSENCSERPPKRLAKIR